MIKFEVNYKVKPAWSLAWLKQVVAALARQGRVKGLIYFSLAFVGTPEMRRLNRAYRGQNCPTDVLSFEAGENWPMEKGKNWGEIIICVPVARRQARENSWTLKEEIARLLIHGLAHLYGYEHEGVSKKRIQEMLDFEQSVMEVLDK